MRNESESKRHFTLSDFVEKLKFCSIFLYRHASDATISGRKRYPRHRRIDKILDFIGCRNFGQIRAKSIKIWEHIALMSLADVFEYFSPFPL